MNKTSRFEHHFGYFTHLFHALGCIQLTFYLDKFRTNNYIMN